MKRKNARVQLNPKIEADKEWYLSLLDEEAQTEYESERLVSVLAALKSFYIARYQRKIGELKSEIAEIRARENYSAEDYRAILTKNAEIAAEYKKLNAYKCFFAEPYFARMDVTDAREGYNSYYIGKKRRRESRNRRLARAACRSVLPEKPRQFSDQRLRV